MFGDLFAPSLGQGGVSTVYVVNKEKSYTIT